jgi:integrase
MRGSLKQIAKKRWRIIVELPREKDRQTGKVKRRQKWYVVHGTRKVADAKLTELLAAKDGGTFIEPSKVTLGEWLLKWLDVSVKPRVRPSSYVRYKGIIERCMLKSDIRLTPLQKLLPSDIEAYYADWMDPEKHKRPLSAATLTLHHAILHRALRKAVKDRLLKINVAIDLDGKPRREHESDDVRQHAWTAEEASKFLTAAKAVGPQAAAFYSLALDSGARKGELCGLRWKDVDLDARTITIERQLLTPGPTPEYGPTKTGKARTLDIDAKTIDLLRVHKQHQAELKMRNRTAYRDHSLVFAKEWADVRKRGESLGQPLQLNNLGQREYAQLIKAAGVRRIKFHGLRHTCATLLLQAGKPIHVVSQRLGHKKPEMTLNFYAHVLPNQQKDAAATIGALLHR